MRPLLWATAVAAALAPGAAAARATIAVFETPEALTAACDAALAAARERADDLRALELDRITPERVLAGWDDLHIALEDGLGPAYIQAYVHPDKAVRDAGQECIVAANAMETTLHQDAALFARVQAVTPGDAVDAKLKRDLIEAFEDTGVTLPPDKRSRAKAILDRVETLGQRFQRNLRENDTTLTFPPSEQAGLPEAYIERVPSDDQGNLVLGLEYPHYFPFMDHADSTAARERYYRAFTSRGGQANLDILAELTELRRELAGLYGLDSYAAYVTRRRMVGDPATVHRFLGRVHEALAPLQAEQLDQLAALKAEHLGTEDATIRPWDKNYYLTRLRQRRYDIDQEALRRYFPMPAMTDWVLHVAARLYGLRFERAEVPVWHEDVTYLDVLDAETGERLGGLYLDLYPRAGKYGHAAAFGVRSAAVRRDRRPISVLVTNFTRSGLTAEELETFLHEIGHALHGVLSTTRYAMHSGTSVELDFVEAPSQMFEAWAQRLEPLATIPEVCADCPRVDADLVERLEAAREAGRALFYGRQWLYASYDMRLAGPEPPAPMAAWERLESATPLGHVPGTAFPGTFGHIAGGYAAGYYGYMWSEALAMDMLARFGDELMNPAVGARFRDKVLARGSERPAAAMVRDFLGRPTSTEAFFEELRGAETR